MTFNLDCYPEVCGLNDANPLFGGTLKKSSEKEFKVSSLKRKITKHKETLSRKKTLQDATLQKQFANSVNEGEAQEVSNSSYQNDPPLSHPNVSENEITYFNNERTSATLKKMICGYLTSSESHIQNYDYDGDCDSTNRLTNFDDVDDITYTSKMDFLIELAKAFILYGVPSHRLESQLHRVSKAVDLKSEFFVLPGVIMISFGNESSESSTHLLKVISGYHMAKLSAVNQLCNDIIDGKASCIEGLYTLDSIAESRFGLNRVGLVSNEDVDIENVKKETLRSNSSVPQRKNGFFGAVEQRFCDRYTFLFIFPIMSFTLCILGFSGTWVDSVFSAFLGLVVGLFVALVAKFPKTSSILEFVSAFFIAILTRLFQLYCYKNGICLNVTITQLSGLSMLLPGMSLTFAITEISTKNLITGTVKLFFALFTAMMIGFGLFMGDSIKFLIKIPNQLSCSVSSTAHIPPFWFYFIAFPLLSLAINLYFQAPLKNWISMSLCSFLAMASMFLFSKFSAPPVSSSQIPVVVTSFIVGLLANISARITDDVALPALLAGMFVMVPGSIGVRATLGFFTNENTQGSNFAFQMLTIGLSITVGFFLSAIVCWPIRTSREKRKNLDFSYFN